MDTLVGGREAVARLIARSDSIAEEMLTAYRAEIPWYQSIRDPEVLAEVKAACRLNPRLILSCLAEKRPLGERERQLLAEHGRRRAEQGVPLHALLRAYEVGARVIHGHLITELERLPLPAKDSSTLIAELSVAFYESVTETTGEVATGYLAAEQERATLQEHDDRDALGKLLAGEASSHESARKLAASSGLVLGSNHVVAVAGFRSVRQGDPAIVPALVRISKTIGSALRGGRWRSLAAPREGVVVAIVAHDNSLHSRDVASALDQAVRGEGRTEDARLVTGVGRSEHGVTGIHASHRQALQVLNLLTAGEDLGGIMTYEDALPLMLLRQNYAVAREIARVSVESLVAHDAEHSSDLLETLDAYLRMGGKVAEAARVLYIHRNTLYFRLEQIGRLTGWRLARREDVLLLSLGMQAVRLFPRFLHPGSS